MKSVAVVMSTYNGEKYLREQLDSILSQVNVSVALYVRDDGSVDQTKQILSEYAENYDNVHVDFAENVGVGNSFMNALYTTPDIFDYYAFADQDDMWLENKLYEAVKLLQESGKWLYASNQENVDKDGNSLGIRFKKDDIHIKPAHILGFNMLAGCTIVFSNEFYKLLNEKANRPSTELLKLRIHDVWVVMVASLFDKIVYDDRSFIKYRQHGNNTSGGVTASRRWKMKHIVKRITHKDQSRRRTKLAVEVYKIFPEQVEKYADVICFVKSHKFKNKKIILKNSNTYIQSTGESKFAFFLKIMFGII